MTQTNKTRLLFRASCHFCCQTAQASQSLWYARQVLFAHVVWRLVVKQLFAQCLACSLRCFVTDPHAALPQSCLFNFQSFLTVILLTVCTCTYVRLHAPSLLVQRDGCVSPLLVAVSIASSPCHFHHSASSACAYATS